MLRNTKVTAPKHWSDAPKQRSDGAGGEAEQALPRVCCPQSQFPEIVFDGAIWNAEPEWQLTVIQAKLRAALASLVRGVQMCPSVQVSTNIPSGHVVHGTPQPSVAQLRTPFQDAK